MQGQSAGQPYVYGAGHCPGHQLRFPLGNSHKATTSLALHTTKLNSSSHQLPMASNLEDQLLSGPEEAQITAFLQDAALPERVPRKRKRPAISLDSLDFCNEGTVGMVLNVVTITLLRLSSDLALASVRHPGQPSLSAAAGHPSTFFRITPQQAATNQASLQFQLQRQWLSRTG